MHRNFFGEPIAANLNEIEEALRETDIVAENATVWINFEEKEDNIYHGFSASIDENGRTFATMGYESKEALIHDLETAGFVNIEEDR